MMKRTLLTGLLLIITMFTAVAQSDKDNAQEESQNLVAHRVEQGETVMLICKKYLITPPDIYKHNPDAIEGISYNMMINIPADKINKKYDRRATTGHQVADTGGEE